LATSKNGVEADRVQRSRGVQHLAPDVAAGVEQGSLIARGLGVERRMLGRTQLNDVLTRQRVLILDGGLATELERRGADLDDPS